MNSSVSRPYLLSPASMHGKKGLSTPLPLLSELPQNDKRFTLDSWLIYLVMALVPTIPFPAFRVPDGAYYLPVIAAPVAVLACWRLVSLDASNALCGAGRLAAMTATTLCGWSILSLTWSAAPQLSQVGSLVFYLTILVLILVFQKQSPATLYRASSVLLVAMIPLVLYGLYIFAAGHNHWFQFTSETTVGVGTRNSDAFMVVTIFPLALSRTLVSRVRMPARIIAGVSGAICITAILLSLSRSATIGVFAISVGMVFLGSRLIPLRPRTLVAVALLSVIALVTLRVYFAASELALSRFGALGTSDRIPLANLAVHTGLAHSITGIGYSEFSSLNAYGEDAHDAYLNLFAELGAPGVTLFALMLFGPVVQYIRLARLPYFGPWLPTKIRVLYLQGFGMLLALALLAATDTFYKSIYFWIVYMFSIMHLSVVRAAADALAQKRNPHMEDPRCSDLENGRGDRAPAARAHGALRTAFRSRGSAHRGG